MIIDFEQLDKPDAYALMTQALIPRPIAWIVSANGTGSFNLAPFSYFTGVCSTPPLLVVSIGKKRDGTRKDTWVNILERGDFVVNIPPADLVHEVQRSSAPLPFGESEVDRCNLKLEPMLGSPLPRLSVAQVAFACRLHEIFEVGDGPQALILGRIERLYVNDSLIRIDSDPKRRYRIDAKRMDPLARLGSDAYATLGSVIPTPDA
ncbi:MAG TPA: protein/domain typically associated with flavoprotein oxygenase, DIM6/NTAB family protein [Verrucomicrobia bacterium]|jgi:flavin reductase (DIM6/NTAB) family NADH-FMN oxidoreductase RutF|nr:protein/domain typically associated with flavoprotein oxygenase, DIM6/NTAB family protein [Verrucomicrobiota bacterium]